jgi:hypothetical protein
MTWTLICLAILAQEAANEQRLPIPDAAQRDEALKIVREVYGGEFKNANSDTEKSALAKQLVAQGVKSAGDPPSCFVLFKVAKDIAEQAHDVQTAFRAIDELAERFNVDGLDLKTDAIVGVASSLRSPKDHAPLAAPFDALLGELIAADRFDLAAKVANAAFASARRARDSDRIKELSVRSREIESLGREFDAVNQARGVLDKDPTDPAANRTVGEFHCLVKGDWDRGLPQLALCETPKLKQAALQELTEPSDAESQLQLADAWFDLAGGFKGGRRDHLLAHAADWYRQAQANATGLSKIKIAKRLEEIGDLKVTTASSGKPTKKSTKADKPLLVHLPLNRDLRDISGNNLHGRPVGDVKLQAPGFALFDGSGDAIQLPHIPLDGRSFAICFWARADKPNDQQGFFEQRGGSGRNTMLHLQTRNNLLRMGFYANDTDTSTPLRPPGQWQHLVFQYGSGKQQIWMDGKLIGSKESIPFSGTTGDSYIGRAVFSRDFVGGMLDFRIYGEELTADEIGALYGLLSERLQPRQKD